MFSFEFTGGKVLQDASLKTLSMKTVRKIIPVMISLLTIHEIGWWLLNNGTGIRAILAFEKSNNTFNPTQLQIQNNSQQFNVLKKMLFSSFKNNQFYFKNP